MSNKVVPASIITFVLLLTGVPGTVYAKDDGGGRANAEGLAMPSFIPFKRLPSERMRSVPQYDKNIGGLEYLAYYRVGVTSGSPDGSKERYLKALSPGGKAYFLACRRDYKEALEQLEIASRKNTASYLYVKGFCQAGLKDYSQALKNFRAAKSKVDLVFNPGYRFYLQLGWLCMLTGHEKECEANLDIAAGKAGMYAPETWEKRGILQNIQACRAACPERMGRYEEACAKYLVVLNSLKKHIDPAEVLQTDDAARAKATLWLKQHPVALAGASEEEKALFFLNQGNAHQTLGRIAEAKESLEQAIKIEYRDKPPYLNDRLHLDERSPLGRIKTVAKIGLFKLFYKERNYKESCKCLRALFSIDPMDRRLAHYNTLSMRDVPQLVTQRDVDAHDEELEDTLDVHELVEYTPTPYELSRVYDFKKDPQLQAARNQAQSSDFSNCFQTLSGFIAANSALPENDRSYREFSKKRFFQLYYQYSAKLFRWAVAVPANSHVGGLSLAVQGKSEARNSDWEQIEGALLGKRTQTRKLGPDSMSAPVFSGLCHFAKAVRAMHKKDFSQAANEFDLVRVSAKEEPDLSVYARVLKTWCLLNH